MCTTFLLSFCFSFFSSSSFSSSSSSIYTVRKELRTKKLTLRTVEEYHTKDNRFVLASRYTSVLRCLSSSPEIAQSDSFGSVLAELFYLCHHPFVSPERKGMDRYVGNPYQTPRSSKTEWDALSHLLLLHGVTPNMTSMDHLEVLLLSEEDGLVAEGETATEDVRTCARRYEENFYFYFRFWFFGFILL